MEVDKTQFWNDIVGIRFHKCPARRKLVFHEFVRVCNNPH